MSTCLQLNTAGGKTATEVEVDEKLTARRISQLSVQHLYVWSQIASNDTVTEVEVDEKLCAAYLSQLH